MDAKLDKFMTGREVRNPYLVIVSDCCGADVSEVTRRCKECNDVCTPIRAIKGGD